MSVPATIPAGYEYGFVWTRLSEAARRLNSPLLTFFCFWPLCDFGTAWAIAWICHDMPTEGFFG